jgi:chemotaxis protein histidine kinase CheA
MPSKDEIEEMWALFCQDYQENLNVAEDALLQLERNPNQPKLVAGLFRAMHTIKGCAGMMGLANLQKFSHRGEDLVALVRDRGVPLSGDMTDALLTAVDVLRQLLGAELARHEDASMEVVGPVTERISAIIQQATPAADAPKPAGPQAPIETKPVAKEQPAASPASGAVSSEAPMASGAISAPVAPAVAVEVVASPTEATPKPPTAPLLPSQEPGYVRIFQEIACAAWPELARLVSQFAVGDPDAIQKALNPLDTISIASERMGYVRLAEPIERLRVFLADASAAKKPKAHAEAWFDALHILCSAVHSELVRLQEEAQAMGIEKLGSLELPDRKPAAIESAPKETIQAASPASPKKATRGKSATPVEPAATTADSAEPPASRPAAESAEKAETQSPVAAHSEKETNDGLNSIMETAGEIVAGHTTFHQVVSMLTDLEPLDAIENFLNQANGDWTQARPRVEAFFAQWTQALQMLSQTEIKIGGAVGRLQEKARSLGAKAEIMDGMVLRVGDLRYVAPVQAIRRIIMPEDSQLASASAEGGERLVKMDNEWLPISNLPGADYRPAEAAKQLFVVVEENRHAVALAVEELLGQQQVLVHALPGPWVQNERVSGCALLGEGEVGVVLRFDE